MKRIVVNLAPADLKKAGPAYDLPIAVGILLSSEQVYADVSQTVFLGELSLDGSLRHTNGVLPMVALAHREGLATVIVPDADAKEASIFFEIGEDHIPILSTKRDKLGAIELVFCDCMVRIVQVTCST